MRPLNPLIQTELLAEQAGADERDWGDVGHETDDRRVCEVRVRGVRYEQDVLVAPVDAVHALNHPVPLSGRNEIEIEVETPERVVAPSQRPARRRRRHSTSVDVLDAPALREVVGEGLAHTG